MTQSALELLGDFTFPHHIDGLPARLSDVAGLKIGRFTTGDGVSLAWWEAGQGTPLVFVPSWGSNGADLINVIHLMARTRRILVLDPRNQGLSDRVLFGGRIARFAQDLAEFLDHVGLARADLAGWSMGAAMIWAYVDLYGTGRIDKLAFIDEPVSIYTHADWSEQRRLEAGGMTTSPERMLAAFAAGAPTNAQVVDMKVAMRSMMRDALPFQNSLAFAAAAITGSPANLGLVLFDHIMNDWRDVLEHKIDRPTAIFSGEESNNLPSQRWMAGVIPGARLYAYTAAEEGDHFHPVKDPRRFCADLGAFLNG
jgi:non-heme chloroperoxidase